MTRLTSDDIMSLQRVIAIHIERLEKLKDNAFDFMYPEYKTSNSVLFINIDSEIKSAKDLKHKICRIYEEQHDQSSICQTTSM